MQSLRNPIFLIGAMRSGTTLLADLLGESDQIVHCPFELKDIWSAVGGVQMASPKTRDEICNELFSSDLQPGQREKLTAAFIERMAAYSGGKAANAAFLNKNPHLCNKLPLVNALFPDARFIWIYRHLPSVVASLVSLFEKVHRLTQTWHYWPEPQNGTVNRCWHAFHYALPEHLDKSRCFPGGEVRYLAEYWLESNRAVAGFFRGQLLDRCFVVQEESLIHDPANCLESCLVFLGLSPSIRFNVSDSIDGTRNSVWEQELSDQSLKQLLEFVAVHSQIIDVIFPGKKYVEKYMQEIRYVIGHRNEISKNSDPSCQSFSAKQLLLGCVTENSPKYLSQTLRLLQSVRWFGGSIANADFRVCAVEDIDVAYKSHFESYGATVRIVTRFDIKSPVTNKIRFLQQTDIHEYDRIMLLDCDTIIVQDPATFLKENVFRAKIADLPTMPHDVFTVLFDFFDLTLPSQEYSCTAYGEPTIPYFNTGVLIFPKSTLSTLVPKWIEFTNKLLEHMDLISGREHFCEQTSMSLALAATGESFKVLGNEMNFPTHLENSNESSLLHNTDPFIIHYHSCFDSDGYINSSGYRLADSRIISFNDKLRKQRSASMVRSFFNKLINSLRWK